MKRIEVVILSNEIEDDHLPWVEAVLLFREQVNFRVVDLTQNSWFEEIHSKPFDFLLAKPGGVSSTFKNLYDERVYILSMVLRYNIFPVAEEIFIYENKRFLSYWLKANKIPHPRTDVFYDRKMALHFLDECHYPLVAKTNIGASGSGVGLLTTKEEAAEYIKETFTGKGASKRSGPNLSRGSYLRRGIHYIFHPGDIRKKMKLYKAVKSDVQKEYVIFQKFIKHDFEWRIVRIGDSFFGHKKIKTGAKASGSLKKEYDAPPYELLDFVRRITDKHHFNSQAIDIFETDGGYLVNEMQCIFGQSDPYQMKVEDKIGRYRYLSDRWQFEEGDFTSNECFNLRLEYILKLAGRK